jgi:AcrR family transcriptional regulator
MLAGRKKPRRNVRTPRDPERTRVRLLQAAFQEIHRSGFRSADLDAILTKAGVTKGALYHHFDNKEALGYAVADEIIASRVHQKWVQPLRNAKNPIDVLIRIFQSESLKRKDVQRGCELLNLAQEMSGLDAGFRRRTARIYKDWHDAMAEALREGQKRRVGGVRRFRKEFAGSSDDGIRPKKRDPSFGVASPEKRPDQGAAGQGCLANRCLLSAFRPHDIHFKVHDIHTGMDDVL